MMGKNKYKKITKYRRITEYSSESIIVECEPGFIYKLFNKVILNVYKMHKLNDTILFENEFGKIKRDLELTKLVLKFEKDNNIVEIIPEDEKLIIPKGWFVFECGQSPVHMLWFVNLVNFNEFSNGHKHPRQIYVEEKNSFNEALTEAIQKLKKI